MKIAVPREVHTGERRVATTPEVVKQLIELGFELAVESGASSGGARRVALATPARLSLPALLSELLSSKVSSWARAKLGTFACPAPEPPPPPVDMTPQPSDQARNAIHRHSAFCPLQIIEGQSAERYHWPG